MHIAYISHLICGTKIYTIIWNLYDFCLVWNFWISEWFKNEKKDENAIVLLGFFIEWKERWPFVILDSFWIHFCSFCVFQVPKWPFDRSRRMQRGMLECSWSKSKRKSMNQLRMYNLDKTPNCNERKRKKYH